MSFSADVDINVSADVDLGAVAGVAGDIASNAKIIPILPPDIPIIFSYNPTKMTLTRKLYTEKRTKKPDKNSTTPTPTPLERWKGTNSTQYKFDGYLEGPQTRAMAEALLSLMSPSGGLLNMIMGLLGGPPLSANLPVVMFMWGTYVIPQAYVETCNVSYERFHISGL